MLARTAAFARRSGTRVAIARNTRKFHGARAVREEGGSGGYKPKSDSLHSSDIAFKPNNDGWGGTKKVSEGWERIFGAKAKKVVREASTKAKQ